MRKIIYVILMIAISGILATAQTGSQGKPQKILIQAANKDFSRSDLSLTAEIIAKRLKLFGMEKPEIKAIPEKNQIEVLLPGDKNLEFAVRLVTKKGVLEFYETLNWEEISGMTDAAKLASLLRTQAPVKSSAQLGCTEASNIGKVDEYLKTTGLDQKCRLLWNDFPGDTKYCLYAMNINNGKGPQLRGSDVESIKISADASGNPAYIDIRFKQNVIGKWAEITGKNLGRSIAIVLDDKVLVAPVLKSVISGGNCQISGRFTETELKYITAICSYGELKADFMLVK
jgi:SecD/SecF fusion protein